MNSAVSPATSTPSKPALALGAFALFFLSFLMSGSGNVLPQLFFQKNYPAQKTLLLSVALLSSTAAAFAGVLISRRVRVRRVQVAVFLLATAALAELLFSAGEAVFFIVCLMLMQFSDNFLLNQIDHAAAARAQAQRGFNDAAGNTARLLGMLSAPAFFTLAANNAVLERLAIAVIGCGAILGAWRLLAFHPAADVKNETIAAHNVPDRADWLVFAYAISIYLALYLFAANMIYLLRDLFLIPGAETRGGIAIVGVFVAALAANALVATVRRSATESGTRTLRSAALAAPAVLLVIVAGLILGGVRTGYPPFLVGAMTIGASYGAFLWEVRDYTSRAARQGKTTLLTWFNNMANISSLFAFGLMLALAAARSSAPGAYFIWLMWAIALVPAAGLILLAGAAAALRTAAPSKETVQNA